MCAYCGTQPLTVPSPVATLQDSCSSHTIAPLTLASHSLAEGVMTVEKKSSAPKHHVLDMPNIHVMDALKSLKSKNLVTETFNWFVRLRSHDAVADA